MSIHYQYKSTIKSWKKFEEILRSAGYDLLKRLDEFPDSILVTGCQRSGTTILSRIITQSDGMVNYQFGADDELDAALILSGYVDHVPQGRYCFQTTYLNECYREYFKHNNGHKIIWVLRNPFSVVYSMCCNWRNFALNELFRMCGSHLLEGKDRRRYDLFGVRGINKLKRACCSYNGKLSHLFEIKSRLGEDRMVVVSYEELVKQKDEVLPKIYKFIDLPYKVGYGDKIHDKSIVKASLLSKVDHAYIDEFCMPQYERARRFVSEL